MRPNEIILRSFSQVANIAAAVWTICVVWVVAIFAYFLWFKPAGTVAPDWISSALLAMALIGSGAFTAMLVAWAIRVVRKDKREYKPFLGYMTSQYLVIGVTSLMFMGVEIFGIVTKSRAEVVASTILPHASIEVPLASVESSETPIVTSSPHPVQPTTQPKDSEEQWGIQKQVSEHTWTMKMGSDPQMTTVPELYEVLNNYRVRHGANPLEQDEKLTSLAQLRAHQLAALGGGDEHAGFSEYMKDPDNVQKLGYNNVSENYSFGYRLNGVHIIEWAYSDPPHDQTQKNPKWTRVGVAVEGTITVLIFAR